MTTEEVQTSVPAEIAPDQTNLAPAAWEVVAEEGSVWVNLKSEHDIAARMKLSPNMALYFGNDVIRASEKARAYVAPESPAGPTGSVKP